MSNKAIDMAQRRNLAFWDPSLAILPPVIHGSKEVEESSRRQCLHFKGLHNTMSPHVIRHGQERTFVAQWQRMTVWRLELMIPPLVIMNTEEASGTSQWRNTVVQDP
jgi:hypothetical protein